MIWWIIGTLLAVGILAAAGSGHVYAAESDSAAEAVVPIPAGSYQPLYRVGSADSSQGAVRPERVSVDSFHLDAYPVTNRQFLEFVTANPEWQRSRAKRLFVEDSYLSHWKGDLSLGSEELSNRPVVNVSWFAAKAYCEWRNCTLPTVDQWEYVAAASAIEPDASQNPEFQKFLRTWYSRPTPDPLPEIGTLRNYYGVYDLHGLVWEWTLDFNSALVTGESRADASIERSLYCGAGASGASDFENYAAFMRYAFRSSLEARYAVPNLGFRCACEDLK